MRLFPAISACLLLANSVATASEPAAAERIARLLDEMLERAEKERTQKESEPGPPSHAPPKTADRDEQIRQFAQRYWNGRERSLVAALERLEQFRPALEGVLRSEGLPAELVAVVLVESAAQPLALSPKQARGLWQFIPATARRYGLRVNERHDDRIHLERATRAAARYLSDLYARFGDWQLALAGYNAGEYAVERALARTNAADFQVLSARRLLPRETRNYVPAVLDAVVLLGGLRLDPPQTPIEIARAGTSALAQSD